jgi:hypothetical protein
MRQALLSPIPDNDPPFGPQMPKNTGGGGGSKSGGGGGGGGSKPGGGGGGGDSSILLLRGRYTRPYLKPLTGHQKQSHVAVDNRANQVHTSMYTELTHKHTIYNIRTRAAQPNPPGLRCVARRCQWWRVEWRCQARQHPPLWHLRRPLPTPGSAAQGEGQAGAWACVFVCMLGILQSTSYCTY